MRYLIDIKREKVVSFSLYDPKTETATNLGIDSIPLKDILIYCEDGVFSGNLVFQALLDHELPYLPNRFSIARKLAKYKRRTS